MANNGTNGFFETLRPYLFFTFIVFSWPFFYFPFTDGDISNWIWVAQDVADTGRILSGPNDQTHGPLMSWAAGAITALFGPSFYMYGLFNILCGVLGSGLVFYTMHKLFKNSQMASLATLFYSTSLATVYLSRTPMYDWPATIFFTGFGSMYLLYIKEEKPRYLALAALSVGIGSLSRFSIVLGLSGIMLIGVNILHRRHLGLMIRDGLLITLAAFAMNLPWVITQSKVHGEAFFNKFMYDNFGRFVKSTRVNAYVRKDYYGFTIYTLVGLLPHTFMLLGTLFQKATYHRLKENKWVQSLVLGFLPCLLIFSFSGHTKLGRYIAYIFPFLSMSLAYFLNKFDLHNAAYRKRSARMTLVTGIFLALLLGLLIVQFQTEVRDAWFFALAVILLLFSLLSLSFYSVKHRFNVLLEQPSLFLPVYGAAYMAFFTVLAFEAKHAPFLKAVHQQILNVLR